jgi:PEP-CTERM motif
MLSVGAVALLCLTPSAANAATLDFTGMGKAEIVNISGSLRTVTAYAGELDWNWLGTPPAGFSQSLYTYCVDILNNEADPQYDVTVRSTDDMTPATSPYSAAGAGAKIAWLVNTYAASIHSSGTNEQAAGLQIAIWETLYDSNLGGFNLASGQFIVSASVGTMTWATTYLASLAGNTGHAAWLDSPGNGTGQDQVTVPEPSTLALLMLAGGLLFAYRRKPAASMTIA